VLLHLTYCFFFSSRRRHTRFSRDWSSDVCSSDLTPGGGAAPWSDWTGRGGAHPAGQGRGRIPRARGAGRRGPRERRDRVHGHLRSEERRVGKEWRSRGTTEHSNKNTEAKNERQPR